MPVDLISENVLICSALLGTSMLFGYAVKVHGLRYLPESSVAMLTGILFGMLSQLFNFKSVFQFSGDVFFYGLLPIIIFNAGFLLKKKEFFKNFGAITLFAVVGTIVSALVYGILTYLLFQFGWISHLNSDHPLLDALMFGSLISATDPVATLSILQDVHAPGLLYNLVFGESLVNDASSIVLFKTFESFLDTDFTLSTIAVALFWFCVISIGSLVIGIVVSFLCALLLIMVENHSEYAKFELGFILLSAYVAYAFAEMLGLSGIMSLFFCGISNSHYSFYDLCHASKISSKYSFEALAFMSELFVFAYLGMQVVIVKHEIDFGLILSAIPLCLVSRAFNIFPLSFLANIFRKQKITAKMQIMMWLSGLRGAIAFALSVNFPGNNKAIETTTLYIVIFTTVVFGSTTSTSLSILGLSTESDRHKLTHDSLESLLLPLDDEKINKNGIRKWFNELDKNFLRPLFRGYSVRDVRQEEDDFVDEDPDLAYEEYTGSNFSVSIPEEWIESFKVITKEGVLMRFVSSYDGKKNSPCSVTVSRLNIPGIETIIQFKDPLSFLSENWDQLDLGDEKSVGIDASQSDLGNPRRHPLARLGSSKISVFGSYYNIGVNISTKKDLESGKGTSIQTNKSLESVAGMARDEMGITIGDKSSEGSVKVDNCGGKFEQLKNLKSQNVVLDVSSKQKNTKYLIPAFVMWSDTAKDMQEQSYFRYEIVVHPDDLGASARLGTQHLLMSIADYNGHILICTVRAAESWWYTGGHQVAKSIIDSFRVGGFGLNVDER